VGKLRARRIPENGWASHYANLQSVVAIRTDLYRPRAQYVRAGDTIG
jgi:hypothetical protein